MHTWHVERKRLASDRDNLDWALKNGLDKTTFEGAYQSFGVQTRLKNLPRLAAGYQVDSTPTLIVGGRYLTNPSMVAGANPGLPRQGRGASHPASGAGAGGQGEAGEVNQPIRPRSPLARCVRRRIASNSTACVGETRVKKSRARVMPV